MEKFTEISISGLTYEGAKKIISNYNDVTFTSNYDREFEAWIGLKGGQTIKAVWGCGDEFYMTDYGISVETLRADHNFIVACLNDGDVNHALSGIYEHECFVDDDREKEIKWVMEWFLGKKDLLPVTPCGLQNYIDYYDHCRKTYTEEDMRTPGIVFGIDK